MVRHLFSYEWKRTIKHPALLFFVVFFPMILVATTGLFIYSIVKDEVQSIEVLVVDEDQTFETRTLISQLQSDETLEEQIFFITGEKSLSEYMDEPSEYAAIVQIPQGFTDDLRNGINKEINVYLNDEVPFGSSLSYLILESGQDYISAAQTGVNTVNNFYIRQLEDRSERSRWIQQMTIHFTVLALNRNDLFLLDETISERVLTWNDQLFVMAITVLFLLTFILWSFIFQPKNNKEIQKRLALLAVRPKHFLYVNLLKHVVFSFLFLLFIITLLAMFIFHINLSVQLYVHWMIIALLFISIYLFIQAFIKHQGISLAIFFVTALFIAVISGLIIPPAYLPGNLWGVSITSFQYLHEGLKIILLQGDYPYMTWIVMLSISMLLILVSRLLVNRRVVSL